MGVWYLNTPYIYTVAVSNFPLITKANQTGETVADFPLASPASFSSSSSPSISRRNEEKLR
jgi:hypothetical protein